MFLTLDKANKFTLFSLNRNIHDLCGSEYYLHYLIILLDAINCPCHFYVWDAVEHEGVG